MGKILNNDKYFSIFSYFSIALTFSGVLITLLEIIINTISLKNELARVENVMKIDRISIIAKCDDVIESLLKYLEIHKYDKCLCKIEILIDLLEVLNFSNEIILEDYIWDGGNKTINDINMFLIKLTNYRIKSIKEPKRQIIIIKKGLLNLRGFLKSSEKDIKEDIKKYSFNKISLRSF